MSLKDNIQSDIENIFMNVNDFCDSLTIHVGLREVTAVGSLQTSLIKNTSGIEGAPLQSVGYKLYLKYPLVMGTETATATQLFSYGTHITIDGHTYTVLDVADEMGLATVTLEGGVGR